MTEPMTSIPTSRYGAWAARVRRGLHSDNPAIASLIRALDLGLCPRPVAAWSILMLFAVLGSMVLVFLDGPFTALALSDPAHPFVQEAWGPTAMIISLAGIPGLLVAKFLQVLVLFAVLDIARLRGLPTVLLVVSLLAGLSGALLVANSIAVLLSTPTQIG